MYFNLSIFFYAYDNERLPRLISGSFSHSLIVAPPVLRCIVKVEASEVKLVDIQIEYQLTIRSLSELTHSDTLKYGG
jgi:hypothetical protein